jgi:hypothetical protein
METDGSTVGRLCLRLLRDFNDAELNAEVFRLVIQRLQHPVCFALALLTVGSATELPESVLPNADTYGEREWLIATLFSESHGCPPYLAVQIRSLIKRCGTRFNRYVRRISAMLPDGVAMLTELFRDSVRKLGLKAIWLEALPDDIAFVKDYHCWLDQPPSDVTAVLAQLEERTSDPFTCGVLALLGCVVQDVLVTMKTPEEILANGFLIDIGDNKYLVPSDLRGSVVYDPVRHNIDFQAREFSTLTSDEALANAVLRLFARAIRSRESSTHLLTLRAVGAALRNPCFVKLGRAQLDFDDLAPFCGPLGSADHLIAQWRTYCRCPGLPHESDVYDEIKADGRFFAVLPSVPAGVSWTVTARGAKECGIVEESGDDALFSVIEKRDIGSASISVVISQTGLRFGDRSFVAPDGARWRCFFSGITRPRVTVPADLFPAPGYRFADRAASGRFDFPEPAPLLQLPRSMIECARVAIARACVPDFALLQPIPIDNATIRSARPLPALFTGTQAMSLHLRAHIGASYMRKITEQAISVVVLRLHLAMPDVGINSDLALRLFVHLVVALETYHPDRLARGRFPFKLSARVRAIGGLTADEVRKVLHSVRHVAGFVDRLRDHLDGMAAHNDAHFPPTAQRYDNSVLEAGTIIFVPSFGANSKISIQINGVSVRLPVITTARSNRLHDFLHASEMAIFRAPPAGNIDWVYQSPFLYLILLKWFIEIARSPADRDFATALMLDALLIDSPFISLFCAPFLKSLARRRFSELCPPNPETIAKEAQLLSGSYRLSTDITDFLRDDRVSWLVDWPIIAAFGSYFPEFFTGSPPALVPFEPGSPIAEVARPELIIRRLASVMQRYEKLTDFPFYIAALEWIEINGVEAAFSETGRAAFLEACKQIVLIWREEHSRQLVIEMQNSSGVLQQSVLSEPTGPFAEATVRVVAHIVDKIHGFYSSDRPPAVIPEQDGVADLLPFELLRERFVPAGPSGTSSITTIKVNRLLAATSEDARKDGIVAQVARAFALLPPYAGRGTPCPWSAIFMGETGHGLGASFDLLSCFCASVFDPATRLVIPCPTSPELFLPFDDRPSDLVMSQYRMIGVVIGMMVRCRVFHAMPFAPFVYRFLAGGSIRDSDIMDVDANLRDIFRGLAHHFPDDDSVNWSVPSWTGTLVQLPGHPAKSSVKNLELADYVHECIQYRITELEPFLQAIRKGFVDNIGMKSSPYLSGSFISRACQGDEVTSVQSLRSVASYTDYTEDDPSVVILWRVVEQMTNEQKSLFLKFATGMTRLPLPSQQGFTLHIRRKQLRNHQLSSPNQVFPTATTCFKHLYLPPYTDFKAAQKMITYAVMFSPTLELD